MITQLTQLFSLFTSGMTGSEKRLSSTWTLVILFFLLVGLVMLLIFLYKKLNRESNGEYTIWRMVYKEGGVRDQVRGAALALETRLGVQLWPHSDTEEYGSEMQEIQDEEMEKGGSQGSDSEGDDHKEEDNVEQCGKTEGKESGTSDDDSSLEGSEAGERTRLTDQPERAEKGEEKEERVGDGEGKGETSRGAGLLIDLKQFSGSAIWSEEEGGEVSDVTAL